MRVPNTLSKVTICSQKKIQARSAIAIPKYQATTDGCLSETPVHGQEAHYRDQNDQLIGAGDGGQEQQHPTEQQGADVDYMDGQGDLVCA